MKKYVVLSIAFLCSIGLTSCWFKNEKYAGQTDIKVGDIIDAQALEAELASEGIQPLITPIEDEQTLARQGIVRRLQPLSLGRVHYFSDVAKRHTHSHEAFNEIMDASDYPHVIVDFYADWCGPCKTLGAFLNDLAPKHPSLLIVKVNIEQFPEIAQQFNVKTLPTVLFFKNSSLIKRLKGFNKKELLQTIKSAF